MVDQASIPNHNASSVPPQKSTTLERLHNWLKPTKYAGDGSELEKHASSHLEGTGQWLIDSPIFQQWHYGNDHGILWIRGVPGAGKSVLAAKLVGYLTSEECPVLHFFFRHTIESNHRPEAALRDWIAQALSSSPSLQLALKNLAFEDEDAASVDSLSISDLWHLLQVALRSIPKAYFVVDALDESDQDVLEDFLRTLDQLGNTHPYRIKLVITSRPIPTIERIVRNLRLLDIRLNNDQVSPDILKYLHYRIDQVSSVLENHGAIVHEILKRADGLFLYAKLAMDTISRQESLTEQEILEVIDKTPLNLSMIYSNLLREHIGRTGLPEGLSIFVLQLVTHASRPLRLLEIADCIKVTRPEYTQDTATMKSLIRRSCGPLLEVLPDETVRVVHHSLTEYLFGLNRSPSDRDIPVFEPAPTHNVLALLCLSYLQAGCLDTLECMQSSTGDKHKYIKNPQLSPFMPYAATNWHVHTTKSSAQRFPQDTTNDSIFSLLMTPQNSEKLALLRSLEGGDDVFWERLSWNHNITLEARALLIALHLDLNDFAKSLLSRIDMETAAFAGNRKLQPPLHKAIIKGNLEMVILLISKGMDISHYNAEGKAPLHVALECKTVSPAIVKHLLDVGANPWQRLGSDDDGHKPWDVRIEGTNEEIDNTNVDLDVPLPPIQLAFSHGDEPVAKMFLAYINSERAARLACKWVLTILKRVGVMRLILNLGLMDINARIHGETLLFDACIRFDTDVVKTLLDAGADPNVPRDEVWIDLFQTTVKGGENVLHGIAAPKRYRPFEFEEKISEERLKDCFALVLAAGANVNQANDEGMTPLHQAITPLVAQLLLDAGADPLTMDKNGLTPLHVAYSVAVVEVLVTKMDINTRSRGGRTILLQILDERDYRETPRDEESRHGKALKLLDLGVDPSITDNNGDGPLHYLTQIGAFNKPDGIRLFERLIQAGVDINLRNNQGQTALHTMDYRDYLWTGLASLKPLLDIPGVDVNAVDNDGCTFLFNVISQSGEYVYRVGEDEFVAVMVKAGADFNLTDTRGRTLLHAFMEHVRSKERMVELLVEKGVDPRQTDHEGNTIWHEAASWFDYCEVSEKLFHTITSLGVDPRKPNNRGMTPLHVVCEHDQRRLMDKNHSPYQGKRKTSLFEYILEQSLEDINRPDNDGVLPLHILSTFSTDLTRRLLDAGADATPATNEGLNVFHLASRGRQSNVIGLLIDWFKAKRNTEQLVKAVNAKDERGRNPLYYACASGRYQSVDLLTKAGAVPALEIYENSVLQGCVEFEKELKNWRNGTYEPGAGAVNIDGTARPAQDESDRHQGSYTKDRLDEILNLLTTRAVSVSSQAVDQAIATAADRQHDYTVESLLRFRQSSGIRKPLLCSAEVQTCLERRSSLLADVTIRRQAEHSFSSQIQFMIAERLYDAIPPYIQAYYPQPESQEFYEVLIQLSRSGYTWLLDALLTPEVISDLEKGRGSIEDGKKKSSGQDMTSILFAACLSKQPNLHAIELLVKRGAKPDNIMLDVNLNSFSGPTTALHLITTPLQNRWWQTEQSLPYMLQQGVGLEVRDRQGLTPLHLSIDKKDQPSWSCRATEMLLQAGANPSSVDDQGKSCLARVVGHESLFQLLVRYGADFDPAALASAILAKDVEMIERMLASGADSNARKVGLGPSHWPSEDMKDPHDEAGLYPLDLLITSMGFDCHDPVCVQIIALLFDHGADPNSRYPETTIAHRVLGRSGSLRYVVPSDRGKVEPKRNHYVDVILEHPLLDINIQDATKTPLLHVAYKAGDMQSTKLLIERGADIRLKDDLNRNILHQSPDYGFQNFDPHMQLQLLETLSTSASELIHQTDKDGRTPLHYASSRCSSPEEIEFLIAKGAEIHAKDAAGDTALHLLLKQEWSLTGDEDSMSLDERKKRIVNILLSKGLNINVRNNSGDTPVFGYFREGALRARTSRVEELRNIRTSTKKIKDFEDKIALEREPSLWMLFDQFGVDWTVSNDKRQSLFHVVAARYAGNQTMRMMKLRRFEFLMGKGLDVFAEDINGQTALDIAAVGKAEEILTLFKVD